MRRTQSTPSRAVPDAGVKTADLLTKGSSPVANPLSAMPKVEQNTIEQMAYLHRPDVASRARQELAART